MDEPSRDLYGGADLDGALKHPDVAADRLLRKSILSGRPKGLGLAVAVGVVAVVFYALTGFDGSLSFLLGGLVVGGLGSVAFALTGRDLARRPAPRIRGGVVIQESALVRLANALLVLGLVLILVSAHLTDGGLTEMVEDGRRGRLALLVIWLSPVLVVWGVAKVVLPDRVLLTPEGVSARRDAWTWEVPWDELAGVEADPVRSGLFVRLRRTDGGLVRIGTYHLDVTLWEMRAVLRHYLEHPEQRAELETQDALDTIELVRDEAAFIGPAPQWFARAPGAGAGSCVTSTSSPRSCWRWRGSCRSRTRRWTPRPGRSRLRTVA